MTQDQANKYIAKLFGVSNRILDALSKKTDIDIANILISAYRETDAKLAHFYGKIGDDISFENFRKYNRLESLEKIYSGILSNMGIKIKRQAINAIKQSFRSAYYLNGYAMEVGTGVSFGFYGLDENVVRAAIINPYDQIKWDQRLAEHINTLNGTVRNAIVRGVREGWPYSKTGKYLQKNLWGVISKNSSEVNLLKKSYEIVRLVRVETQRAQTMGRNLGFINSQKAASRLGLSVKHIWDAVDFAPPERMHNPPHQNMDGQEADKNGQWHLDDIVFDGPAMASSVAHSMNCRCRTFTRVMDPKNILGPYVQNKVNISDWAKEKQIKLDF